MIELLMAVVIISLAAVALLSALTTSITSSSQHRRLTVQDTLVKSLADKATYAIQLNPSSPLFANCATAGATGTYSNTKIGWTDPTQYNGYQTSISQVLYWDSTTNTFANVSSATCTGSPSRYQNGIQELVVTSTANSGSGPSLNLVAIVRDPKPE